MKHFLILLVNGYSFDLFADSLDFNPSLNFNIRFILDDYDPLLSINAFSVSAIIDLSDGHAVFNQKVVYDLDNYDE